MNSFKQNLDNFLKQYGIVPNTYHYYEIAFFHPDIKCNNTKTKKNIEIKRENNQRLEYFGDSIYLFCINSYLFDLKFNKNSNSLTDKQMSNTKEYFISGKFQVKLAKSFELDKLITKIYSCEVNEKILEDIFESFICAIYLDQNMDITKKFINEILFKNYPIIINGKLCKIYKYSTNSIQPSNQDIESNKKTNIQNPPNKDSENIGTSEKTKWRELISDDERKKVDEIIKDSTTKNPKETLQKICQLINAGKEKKNKDISYKKIVK